MMLGRRRRREDVDYLSGHYRSTKTLQTPNNTSPFLDEPLIMSPIISWENASGLNSSQATYSGTLLNEANVMEDMKIRGQIS